MSPLTALLVAILAFAIGAAAPCAAQDAAEEVAADALATETEPAPPTTPTTPTIGERRQRALERSLAGDWYATIGRERIPLTLTRAGGFSLDDEAGRYEVEGATLTLISGDRRSEYAFEVGADSLTLSGADLEAPLKFTRMADIGGYIGMVEGFSPSRIAERLRRIGIILLIVLAAHVVLALLQALSRIVVLSQWGPLALLFRRQKNRTLTIHAIVINLLKYIVYFTAFGFILTEIGVNYVTYLASLSVIGLAIGFGSQGLVQDMVTGFFLIFENQFDVGDMIEISGQTGIVHDMGLRATRLRNYQGQTVTIPNRNIATVGRFKRGSQTAQMDVFVADEASAERAAALLRTLGKDLSLQFEGVILAPPRIKGPVKLETGDVYVRMNMSFWPNQSWVIEQELAPRAKELLGREGVEVAGDRVTIFYRAREMRKATSWRQALLRIGRRGTEGGR